LHKKVVKNEFLLNEGEVCLDTFFVEKGLLRMYSLDRNGKEHIIQFAPENWLISDRSSLNFNEKSNYYIEAVEDSEVYVLSKDFFTNMVEAFPQTAENNDLLLQKHIRNLQNRVNSLLADTAEERYMTFIKMYPDILLRVPQWMVASYLGITPESLSRVRKELARKNFVPS
jgi:CRP-like cAMP-binding protein